MRTARVLVVSAIAHAPLLLYLADAVAPRARPSRVLSGSTPLPAATAIDVVFLVEQPTAEGRRPRRLDERMTARRTAMSHAGSGVADSEVAGSKVAGSEVAGSEVAGSEVAGSRGERSAAQPGAATTRPSGTGLMRMRGPDLDLPRETAERIAAGGDRPDELKKSGRLEAQPGGRAVVHDRVTTMTVDPDGKVHFDDKKDIDLKFKLPIPKVWEVEELRKDLGHELTEWFKDPEAATRYRPSADLPRHLQAAQFACDRWSAVFCDDPLAPQIEQRVRERKKVTGSFLGGAADITAWLHRKYVGDPYLSRKLKLLDDTRDERIAMRQAHRAQQQARSAELVRKNLEHLWAIETDPVARRAALFELWDDCGDDEAGTRARAVVIGWIRTHLPAGSQHAYTDAELNALQNHKTSAIAFTPYHD